MNSQNNDVRMEDLEHVTPSGHELQVGDTVQHLQTFELYEVVELSSMLAQINNPKSRGEKISIISPAAMCRHIDTGGMTRLWAGKIDLYVEPNYEPATADENQQVWDAYAAAL